MLLISKKGLRVLLPETTSPPEVRKFVNWEVQNEEGSTDYTQTYKGYSLAEVTLYWRIGSDQGNVYKVLSTIQKVYSHLEDGKPAIWKVVDQFLNSQEIRYLVVKDYSAKEITEGEEIEVTLILMEYRPKEIEKEKKSSTGSTSTQTNPCADEKNLAESECQELYIKWRTEKEKALMNGAKTFPDFKTWLQSQPPSPASDDEV
jgi:hypothetical protein